MDENEGMIAPYVASSLVYLSKLESKSQFGLVKDHNSIRMNDFLINGDLPVSLYSNILTFRDTKDRFILQ